MNRKMTVRIFVLLTTFRCCTVGYAESNSLPQSIAFDYAAVVPMDRECIIADQTVII